MKLKLTSREKKLIILMIFIAIIVFYISFIFRPFYSSYTQQKEKNSGLVFEINAIKQSLLSVDDIMTYNTKMIGHIHNTDMFTAYLNNDEIELYLMNLADKSDFAISGFMVLNDTEVTNEQSLKPSNIELIVKYVTLTLDGNITNLDKFLEQVEANKWIELNGIRYFDSLGEEEPLITIDLICYLKGKSYEEIE